MKTQLDCLPCFVRQSLEIVGMLGLEGREREDVLRAIFALLAEIDFDQSPPAMAQRIHRMLRERLGRDPYAEAKRRFNRWALDWLPLLEQRVAGSARPFEAAVRAAIAGNIIDFGVGGDLTEEAARETIEGAFAHPFDGDCEALEQAASEADRILYLADNAGEIVFDRLLLARLPRGRVTLAVKGGPILNDATLEDAREAGIGELAEVIDNGSDAPGTILEDCSQEFRRCFEEADLIISKGQGNYETLSETPGNIHFLLKTKCDVIARHAARPLGAMVLTTRRCGAAGALAG